MLDNTPLLYGFSIGLGLWVGAYLLAIGWRAFMSLVNG